jgi:hypothetical protein
VRCREEILSCFEGICSYAVQESGCECWPDRVIVHPVLCSRGLSKDSHV